MLYTVNQSLESMPSEGGRRAVAAPLKSMAYALSSQSLQSGALRISGGSASPLAQTNAIYYGVANGKLVKIASAVNMPALVGTVANGMFNVFAFRVNSAGVTSVVLGAAASTLQGVAFPAANEGTATIGMLIINPTGTGAFVGGTTNLDDATVVPNAVFLNTLGAFDPTIIAT